MSDHLCRTTKDGRFQSFCPLRGLGRCYIRIGTLVFRCAIGMFMLAFCCWSTPECGTCMHFDDGSQSVREGEVHTPRVWRGGHRSSGLLFARAVHLKSCWQPAAGYANDMGDVRGEVTQSMDGRMRSCSLGSKLEGQRVPCRAAQCRVAGYSVLIGELFRASFSMCTAFHTF